MKHLVNRIGGLVIGQVGWWVGRSFEVMAYADVLKRNSWTENIRAGRNFPRWFRLPVYRASRFVNDGL
jgi:hypothetical protein